MNQDDCIADFISAMKKTEKNNLYNTNNENI